MSNFTPGPWEVEAAYHQGARVVKGREGWIARVEGYGPESRRDPEQDANARLIASAPDLYAALKACEKTLTALLENSKDWGVSVQAVVTNDRETARAVLLASGGEA